MLGDTAEEALWKDCHQLMQGWGRRICLPWKKQMDGECLTGMNWIEDP